MVAERDEPLGLLPDNPWLVQTRELMASHPERQVAPREKISRKKCVGYSFHEHGQWRRSDRGKRVDQEALAIG
jgi:hypothetical protein